MFDRRGDGDRPPDPTLIRRFAEMIQQTPALRAAQWEMLDKGQVAAEGIARRAGVRPDDPGATATQADQLRMDHSARSTTHVVAGPGLGAVGFYLGQIQQTSARTGAPTVVIVIPHVGQFDTQARYRSMYDFRFQDA